MTTTLTPLPSGLWSLTLIADDGTEQVIEARDGGGLTMEECEEVLDELEHRNTSAGNGLAEATGTRIG